ncbi:hypothetical protein TcasGA2_TC011776 [Tribolium castaneum]|uniref:Uncharacterized protein n=1 Tax=Tribolium castaneum TaxID=7070 RepID=D6WZT5_TRICA|nr:hypothetical protein TcasGA2_TC011776 [Tribolium castaneum]
MSERKKYSKIINCEVARRGGPGTGRRSGLGVAAAAAITRPEVHRTSPRRQPLPSPPRGGIDPCTATLPYPSAFRDKRPRGNAVHKH